ncbi:hypothetical protein AU188_18195 [Mycobacterium sp. IS-3022]|nr:hypothetical protein AU188_18195 [Mycobacterium sp. IS-3022]
MERHLHGRAGRGPNSSSDSNATSTTSTTPSQASRSSKSWAPQGRLHRIVDEHHDHNVCYFI